jgi:hypothetical protein
MADEREGRSAQDAGPSKRDELQTAGRRRNAAQPLNAEDRGGPERYPETRTFAPGADDHEDDPDRDASGSLNHERLGSAGDPAEGKR